METEMKLSIHKKIIQVTALTALAFSSFSAQAVTAGPGAWSSQQTWAADSVNGGSLTGYFYWPSTQPTKNGLRALVLVLHGCNQTATNDVINGSDGGYNMAGVAQQYGAVILAPNATGNVYNNHCWDYTNTSTSRTSGHVGILLDLINRFKNDAQYSIDPNQVYVTGLSSGGGMTMRMGCIAPDVFAGIGNNAGPALGTTSSQIGSVPSGVTASTAANQCNTFAGTNKSYFSTQIAGGIWGASDFIVGQAYGPLNMAAMRIVYGGTFTKQATQTVTGGGTNTPYTDSNGKLRTHEISVASMSHAWPAGSGGQNTNYVDNTKVNYPSFVMNYWFTNNLRAGGGGTTTTTTSGGGTTTTAATTTTTTVAATCYTSSNNAHVTAGRAHDSGGYALANGSNANMGLDNLFYTTTLKKTGTNYYVIGTCP
jgi:poly(3-hydroxybutyrate) depolymerase